MPHSLGDGIRAVEEHAGKQRADAIDLIKQLGDERALGMLMDALAIQIARNVYAWERDYPKFSGVREFSNILTHLSSKAASELMEMGKLDVA